MARDTHEVVRELCLWLPEAEEFVSHGSPNFRVRGKTFATYVVNHHGDGRIALWLPALPGSQELHVREQPKHFFVPPYVGPRGWLGIRLDQGLNWQTIADLVQEGYEKVAPLQLRRQIGKMPKIKPPSRALTLQQIDPLQSVRARALMTKLRVLCARWRETNEGLQFGHPVWRAGKKTFLIVRPSDGELTLCFWVGVDQQGLMASDPRFRIPPYIGHNGWIALDVQTHRDWKEVAALAEQSYRHFALKRMLRD